MKATLQDMTVGETGTVSGYAKGTTVYREKLLAMGLTRGTEITIERIAPMGDPVEIQVRGKGETIMSDHVIGVVGNPNCGKTTLFNAMTGTKQRVGNWPGVTVDRKSGEYTHEDKTIEVVDLPGIYSLSAASLDEEVARDYILSGEADLIVNIIDASNLERNLYLTVQLLEMQVPMVLALNMMDTAKERRIEIDIPMLSKRLGCPVVPLVASQGQKNCVRKSTAVRKQNLFQNFRSYIPQKFRKR
jgi:ferrous iron transport protein B